MAEIKNIVLSIVVVVFAANVFLYAYAKGVENSAEYGAYPDVPANPINSSILAAYNNKTQTFENFLANSTKSASTTPPTTDPLGLGATLSAGGQAVALVFDSLGLMVAMIGEISKVFVAFGLPSFVYQFAVLFIGAGIILAILGAVYKWWI